MTSLGALLILTLILTFHRLNGEGHIDLTIEQLTLGTVPPGCEYNGGLCALNFRLCVDAVDDHFVDTFPADRPLCNILYANFSVVVHGERPYSDRFVVDAPSGVIHQRRFDVTSPMAPNVVVQLDILSDSHQFLLASGFLSSLPTHDSPISPVFSFVNYGNIFKYQLTATCSAGFVGPKCTVTCEPPKPGDHYFCAADGMRCMPGWGGTCFLTTIRSGCLRQNAVNNCACAAGFDGPNCDLSHQQQRRRQQPQHRQQKGHDVGASTTPEDFHGLVTIGTCVAKDSTAQNSGRKWPKYAHIYQMQLVTHHLHLLGLAQWCSAVLLSYIVPHSRCCLLTCTPRPSSSPAFYSLMLFIFVLSSFSSSSVPSLLGPFPSSSFFDANVTSPNHHHRRVL
uniref:EGF-like domain-containing protein n=1 Tax=Globodera rostochiensis TaxID=31243 RepID=A0A914HGS3_GLORO